ncbi:MAG TPA: glycosyltransferase family 39 protein [Gemmatimonadaceae bacterium]|nr:glycosyltransferase family 39 protein [Gemmatimonadaceae bacterium]
MSIVLLGIGVMLRLRQYVDRRSLWLDEIWVALNIVERDFLGLARPLDYAQSAPVGFLWMERIAVVLGGVNELALRVVPFLAGCALLVALWSLARRLLDVRYAALCLAFAALSPILIYYSNEVKPYIVDAMVAVVLTWLALDVLEAPDSPRAWRRLAGGGVIGILLSTPAVFVLAGIGGALITHPAIGRTRVGWLRLVVTGTLWVTLFALGYFLIYRGTANSDYMQSIWSEWFLTLPPRTLAQVANLASRTMWIETLFGENDAMLPPKSIVSVMLLSIVGAIVLLRRRGLRVTLVLLLPFVATAAASFARLWPLTPRLLVALVPAILLLFGAGLWALVSLLPVRARGIVLVLLAGLYLVPAGVYDARTLRTPRRRDDVAPLVRDFRAMRTGPAVMYVMGHGTPSWLFYTARWREREGAAFRFAATRASTATHFQTRGCIVQEPGLRVAFGPTGADVFTDSALAGEARWLAAQPERDVWVLTLSYEHAAGHVLERQLVAQGAVRVAELTRQGAELRRFRLGAAPATSADARCETQLAAPPA